MVMIDVGDPKMARETMCIVEGLVARSGEDRAEEHAARIGKIIDQIDVVRPLGPDGKHGDRHTATCGCKLN